MERSRLEQLVAEGDLEAGQTLLREGIRNSDAAAIAWVRQHIPELAWPGCDCIGVNARGLRIFWHYTTGMRFIEIPGGRCVIGFQSAGPNFDAERTVHLSPYLISECLVPHAVYERFVPSPKKKAPTQPQLPLPRTSLGWEAADEFCRITGTKLPTDAQWERAYRGADGKYLRAREHTLPNDEIATRPVYALQGAPPPTYIDWAGPTGCLQMAWGIWEWCRDTYVENPAASESSEDPFVDIEGNQRSLRGASSHEPWRRWHGRLERNGDVYIGFRMVLERDAPEVSALIAQETRTWATNAAEALDVFFASLAPGPDPGRLKQLQTVAARRNAVLNDLDLQQIHFEEGGSHARDWKCARELSPEAVERLVADVASIDPLALHWHAPIDKKGRLALKQQLVLAMYTEGETPGRQRETVLLARTPMRRKDPQRITLSLEATSVPTKTYNWTQARHRWDVHHATTASARWGTELRWQRLSEVGDPTDTSLTDEERTVLLLDQGLFEEALALCHVAVSDDLRKMIAGKVLRTVPRMYMEDYTRFVHTTLRSLAPWNLLPALRRERTRIDNWRAAKKGRRNREALFCLATLPHQTSSVWDWITLREDGIGGPALLDTQRANDYRLPEPVWRRAVEVDLLRFGLMTREQVVPPLVR